MNVGLVKCRCEDLKYWFGLKGMIYAPQEILLTQSAGVQKSMESSL